MALTCCQKSRQVSQTFYNCIMYYVVSTTSILLILSDGSLQLFITLGTACIFFLVSPIPSVSLAGPGFCQSVIFLRFVHFGGTYMWGTWIALFRVLCVTSQNFLKEKIGVGNLLVVMVTTGISEVIILQGNRLATGQVSQKQQVSPSGPTHTRVVAKRTNCLQDPEE